MRVEKDVYIPMRDGVQMALDIYQPDSGGRRATVLIRTPYLKELADSPSTQSRWTQVGADGRPPLVTMAMRAAAANSSMDLTVKVFVEAGYAVVISDTRGTGYSEGVYDYYNIQGGPFDGYDTVEWIAEQPWSDGNVGMWGVSGSAVTAYAAAVTAPPHLKALAAFRCPTDFYHDQWYPGGVYRYEDRLRWPMVMQDCIAPLNPGDPNGAHYEHKRQIYEQRCYSTYERSLQGLNPINLDWATECVLHDTFDDFWQQRSFAARMADIKVPLLNVGVLHDHFIGGTMRFFEGLDVTQRLLIVPGALDLEAEAGDGGLLQLQTQWFDHFLRGEDNRVLEEPRVRLYLTGERRWIDEPEWPTTTPTLLFLTSAHDESGLSVNDGGLSWDSAGHGGDSLMKYDPKSPNRTPGDAGDQRSFEAGALTFTTAPLDRDQTVMGSPKLSLFAASDAADVDFCVRLCDVYPDGSSRLLNVGSLKGSHVKSHEKPSSLESGKTYEFDIDILTVTNVFKKGHRIRVDVSASDFPFYAPNQLESNTTVFYGGDYSSRLVLPIVES
jgi:uncharacterized protein